MLKSARLLLARKSYREAHAQCIEALKTDPANGEAFFLLGVLTSDHRNFAKALELFERARQAGYDRADLYAETARCLIELGRRDEAVSVISAAIAQNPNDGQTLDTIGVVLSHAGRHEEAVAFYKRAATAAPGNPEIQYNLGAALQFMGEFDDARHAFDKALQMTPDMTRARIARVSITRQTPEQNELDELQAAWNARNVSNPDEALQLAHALAKTSEDLEDPAQAMKWLAIGKAEKAAQIPDRSDADTKCFAAAEALASALRIETGTGANGAIFVTGLPRSGTTLVDRILSSHSAVTSGGELSDFSVALKRAARTPGQLVLDPETLLAAQSVDLASVGNTYLRVVWDTLGLTGRFIDKMPLNTFFVPAILAALPGARVICLRRHPADSMLSIYRQLFATSFSYYRYSYDLEATANYVAAFNQLIQQYEAILPPDRFTIVDYETLVDQTEAETRRMLAHCGLPFETACLSFHESKAPVATASATQVRRPIYRTSLGRWKSYRPAIDPGLDILSRNGLIDPSELF